LLIAGDIDYGELKKPNDALFQEIASRLVLSAADDVADATNTDWKKGFSPLTVDGAGFSGAAFGKASCRDLRVACEARRRLEPRRSTGHGRQRTWVCQRQWYLPM
jgi:hypothetical protein